MQGVFHGRGENVQGVFHGRGENVQGVYTHRIPLHLKSQYLSGGC